MATRGNYVFIEYPHKKDEDGKWVEDAEAIVKLKLGISNDNDIIKNGYKIYVHWDNYPSGAIPRLFEFLSFDGAKARSNDASYLSAWFVAYNCCYGEEDSFSSKRDFSGVGLENNLSDWCDFTYVILPDIKGFRIFIYDYDFNFIDEIHSNDDIEDWETAEWWY